MQMGRNVYYRTISFFNVQKKYVDIHYTIAPYSITPIKRLGKLKKTKPRNRSVMHWTDVYVDIFDCDYIIVCLKKCSSNKDIFSVLSKLD